MLQFILAFLTVSLVSLQSFAQLEVPPDWKFKTLHTPHFDIIYNAEQQDLGLLYAEKLEKSRLFLSHYFSTMPEKTVVIINDKTDLTNGYATRVPYPHIMAYPVLPGPEESLADTGDWAFELLTHEYTHILTFEPATGVMRVVRGIFGSIAAPNILLPTWWKEGLAVQMETRLSNFGRLRSPYQDAVVRAFVESDTLKDIKLPDINEILPTWPEGLRPYLFGAVFWSEMVADKGDGVADQLTLRQSGRAPYFIEDPARDILGRDYEQEYHRALLDLEKRADTQLEKLKQVPPTPFEKMKIKGAQYASAPAISPDGRFLAVVAVSPTNKRQIRIFTRNPGSGRFIDGAELKSTEALQESDLTPSVFDGPPSGSIQRIGWFHAAPRFVYDKVDLLNRIEIYSDLYIYDLHKQKTEALTKGLRAREPAVSPDDQSIAFVKLNGGRTRLGLLRLGENHEVHYLFSPPLQERISYPVFINPHEIVFSLRKSDGSEKLYRIDVNGGEPRPLLEGFSNSRFATWSPTAQGARLEFTSSLNGAHNVYQSTADFSTARPVTHTLTALFSHCVDPQNGDLYATHLGAEGPEIIAMKESDQASLPGALPAIQPLFADRYPAQASTQTTEQDRQAHYEISDYSPGHYLWPRYWIPFVASSSSTTGLVLEAMTSGFDPLKKHSYSLLGAWDTGLNRGSLAGTYLNQQTSLPVLLAISQQNSYFASYDNKFTDTDASLSVLPDTFKVSRYSSLQAGWRYFQRETDSATLKRTGPFALFTYDNYMRAGQAISPETGWSAYLGAYDYIAEKDYVAHSQYKTGGTLYLSRFLPARNALMIKVNGVYTPDRIPALFGEQTEGVMSLLDSPLATYVLRGYKTGQLFGKNLVTANLEYRFPLYQIYRGDGTDPYYLHRLVGSLVSDAAAADGYFINNDDGTYERTNLKRTYLSYGAEVRLETTLGYVFPISFVLGYYYAPNITPGGAGSLGMNLLIGGF